MLLLRSDVGEGGGYMAIATLLFCNIATLELLPTGEWPRLSYRITPENFAKNLAAASLPVD
jgi:hypothetical protein